MRTNDIGYFGNGYYFAPNKNIAEEYAHGGEVYAVFINARNPAIIKDAAVHVQPDGNVGSLSAYTIEGINQDMTWGEMMQFLEENGYDSVIVPETSSKSVAKGGELVVLEGCESNIKSATDNRCTFDGSIPDINFSINPTAEDTLDRFTVAPLGERILHHIRTETRRYARLLGDNTPSQAG